MCVCACVCVCNLYECKASRVQNINKMPQQRHKVWQIAQSPHQPCMSVSAEKRLYSVCMNACAQLHTHTHTHVRLVGEICGVCVCVCVCVWVGLSEYECASKCVWAYNKPLRKRKQNCSSDFFSRVSDINLFFGFTITQRNFADLPGLWNGDIVRSWIVEPMRSNDRFVVADSAKVFPNISKIIFKNSSNNI